MNILSPSILAADFWKLGKQIDEVQKAGAQYLQLQALINSNTLIPALLAAIITVLVMCII